jgi:S-adenosylmethionine:tRNA-ribosyltransferase-isomerase (queuine synthetase)
LVTLGLGGLVAWAVGAQIPVMKVSSQGRIEPHNAVYRLEPPGAGRVVRSMLNLDEAIKKGDLLIEFDTRSERLELEQSKATTVALEQELSVIRDQLANKKAELAASSLVDEVAVREAVEKEGELAPRHRLAEQRAQLAQNSPSGSISELEKLERLTDVDALDSLLASRGIEITFITLHVGIGTFAPVRVTEVAAHTMHDEAFAVTEAAAEAVATTRARGGRVAGICSHYTRRTVALRVNRSDLRTVNDWYLTSRQERKKQMRERRIKFE